MPHKNIYLLIFFPIYTTKMSDTVAVSKFALYAAFALTAFALVMLIIHMYQLSTLHALIVKDAGVSDPIDAAKPNEPMTNAEASARMKDLRARA